MITSTVIDLLIRIKNGYMAERDSIDAIYSRLNIDILKILEKEKYIEGYKIEEDNNKKSLVINLKYDNKKPALTDIRLHSKPGRRVYKKLKDIRPVLGGLGISIVSTSQGVMTDTDARYKKIGGEVICNIW